MLFLFERRALYHFIRAFISYTKYIQNSRFFHCIDRGVNLFSNLHRIKNFLKMRNFSALMCLTRNVPVVSDFLIAKTMAKKTNIFKMFIFKIFKIKNLIYFTEKMCVS